MCADRHFLGAEAREVVILAELHLGGVLHDLDVAVWERLVHEVLGHVQVLQVQRVWDTDEAGLLEGSAPVAADGGFKCLLVLRQDHWRIGPLDEGAGEDVGVHRLAINLLQQSLCGDVREPMPKALPRDSLLRSPTIRYFTLGLSGSSTSRMRKRPMTFVSIPAPL